jgi:hypothetical protein
VHELILEPRQPTLLDRRELARLPELPQALHPMANLAAGVRTQTVQHEEAAALEVLELLVGPVIRRQGVGLREGTHRKGGDECRHQEKGTNRPVHPFPCASLT